MFDLDGITVVSLEQAVAAPYASGRLAQAGARVIKIEREEGDFARQYDALVNGESAYFVWLNHGKQSLSLNLKEQPERDLLNRILAKADVFIQNLSPGAAQRLGFGAADLQQQFPSLINCSISGYGEDGPYRLQKAYDLLIQAESGLCAINGTADGPARVGVSVCDIAAGMSAHQSILQALFARERKGPHHGIGRNIEVSLYQAMADWMNVPYLQYRYGNRDPGRHGLNHPSIAPYGAYPCSDDKMLLISIQNEREWQRLCTIALKQPELPTKPGFASNAERMNNRAAVDKTVASAFMTRTREENIELLNEASIAFGRLSDLDDLLQHPQNRYTTIEGQNGAIELLAPTTRTSGQPPIAGKVPAIGEHNKQIRREFSVGP
ncbi:carnitine dehydratase [Chromatiales bacterium (ex Bugula neritina AB1)]|nr:carnitine dehydratase [Chromatiales bacterium (ex Bugula neritina AB1)]